MTDSLRWLEFLPDGFRPNSDVQSSLFLIEKAAREIEETAKHNRRLIAETAAEIEKRIAAEYSADEIRAAKIRAGSWEFCPCGAEISAKFQNCQSCGRQIFPF